MCPNFELDILSLYLKLLFRNNRNKKDVLRVQSPIPAFIKRESVKEDDMGAVEAHIAELTAETYALRRGLDAQLQLIQVSVKIIVCLSARARKSVICLLTNSKVRTF